MKQSTAQKREEEKKMVSKMIAFYCKKKHRTKNGLCSECMQLQEYAKARSEKCPFMENKTFCSNCKVHCYRSDMREKIRKIMKFSAKYMLFINPVKTVSHLIYTVKERLEMRKAP